jgi:hypothetical protein
MEGGSRQERLIQSWAGGLIAWELLLLRRAMRFVHVAARRPPRATASRVAAAGR